MTVGELLDRLNDLPSDTLVCAAEIDEAFGINIAAVDSATIESRKPNGVEGIELGNSSDTVVVIRW